MCVYVRCRRKLPQKHTFLMKFSQQISFRFINKLCSETNINDSISRSQHEKPFPHENIARGTHVRIALISTRTESIESKHEREKCLKLIFVTLPTKVNGKLGGCWSMSIYQSTLYEVNMFMRLYEISFFDSLNIETVQQASEDVKRNSILQRKSAVTFIN